MQDQLEQQESTEDHQEILSLLYFKIGTEIYADSNFTSASNYTDFQYFTCS